MYYSPNGKDYYWDGKYWREMEGRKASEEIVQELGDSYPGAQGDFPGDEGDRIFVFEERPYWYDQEEDAFSDPEKLGMTLPRAVEDTLRMMLAEPKEEIIEYSNLVEATKAAKTAKASGQFSLVERICKYSFNNFGIEPTLASMYSSALRELLRSREAIEFARPHKDKKWSCLLSSLTGALTDVAKTSKDLEEAEEILELYKKSGGAQGITIRMLQAGIGKRWREIRG